MRPIREDELMRVWPAVRSAKLMATAEQLVAFRAEAPWRVRVSDAGDGLVLDRWRAHLGVLAIKGLWAPEHRIEALLREAAAVARAQGFTSLLSPLLTVSALRPYLAAGMAERERIVAFQAAADDLAALPVGADIRVRPGSAADIEGLVHLDSTAFDEFWHYGAAELEEALRDAQLFVAEKDGVVIGYHTVAHYGATSTVGRLAVAPSMRRRGVARALLTDAGSRAVRAGALGVTLCTQATNAGARALYATSGFLELDDDYALATLEVG